MNYHVKRPNNSPEPLKGGCRQRASQILEEWHLSNHINRVPVKPWLPPGLPGPHRAPSSCAPESFWTNCVVKLTAGLVFSQSCWETKWNRRETKWIKKQKYSRNASGTVSASKERRAVGSRTSEGCVSPRCSNRMSAPRLVVFFFLSFQCFHHVDTRGSWWQTNNLLCVARAIYSLTITEMRSLEWRRPHI